MAKRPLPTPEELRQLLRYEPETGNLFWRERASEMFASRVRPQKYAAQAWNARHAGKSAFTALGTDGYLYGRIWQRNLSAHRVILAMVNNAWPEDYVDHLNHIRTDNRIVNIRPVTPAENARNSCLRNNNTSGICGVDFVSSRSGMPWRARISNIMLGWYRTKDEAIAAREGALKALNYHPHHGRSLIEIQTTS